MAKPAPGDNDPATAVRLREAVRDALVARPELQILRGFFLYLSLQTMFMKREEGKPWWALALPLGDTMSYECNAKLGSPRAVDCGHVENSQLGYPSDTLILEPNAAKTLTSSQ